MTSTSHIVDRIRKELRAAGMSSYGLQKSTTLYLPEVIHKDEHIGGVVYGRYDLGSGMLIATDKRVIFLDRKPLFTTNDEVTYNVVSGLKLNRNGLANTLTLHTKVKDYTLRFVNRECATQFKKYVESRSLEGPVLNPGGQQTPPKKSSQPLTVEAFAFLRKNEVAVLSTSDKKGVVHGAVVYYVTDENNTIYILTKADTTKARNILTNKKVAFTIFDVKSAQTLQIQADATIETDEQVKRHVFDSIMKPHKYSTGYKLPPVAWLDAGMFVIISVSPQSGTYSDFSTKE